LALYPGDVYWVDSGGGGGNKGTYKHPCLTLAAAIALVTTANGDIIAIKPSHAETLTAKVNEATKGGFAIIGLGYADNRPTFTMGLASNGDQFDFAGDNVLLHNLKFAEGASAATSVVWFNVSGNWFTISNCYIELGGKTLVLLTHDTTAKKGLTFIDNTVVGTAAGPSQGLVTEKTHLYMYCARNKWLLAQSAGMDDGIYTNTSGSTNAGNFLIEDDVVIGLGDGEQFMVQTKVPNMSLIRNCHIMGTSAWVHLGTSTAAGYGFIWNFCTEEGKGVPAAIDIQGVRPVNTTPVA